MSDLAKSIATVCQCDTAQILTIIPAALRHGSSHKTQSYERLEFLGDRVLGLRVAHILFDLYPDDPEGGLAKRHAELVSEKTLDAIGTALNIDAHIDIVGNAVTTAVRADVMEAIIGTLYKNIGLEYAAKFIDFHWFPRAEQMQTAPENPRSLIQEWTMKRHLPPPLYQEVARKGDDHAPQFCFSVTIDQIGSAEAWGTSKQNAKSAAAAKLAHKIHKT